MAYRQTPYCARKLRNMRESKDKKRQERNEPATPILPYLRRHITIIDYDFGMVDYHFTLYRTSRIDCYKVSDGERVIYNMIGWSKLLREIGKGFPRVSAQ